MKKIVKQVLGVDVAQNELVVCFGVMLEDWTPKIINREVFANNTKGFQLLLKWVNKQAGVDVKTNFVMEATGVYHESFAYFLNEHQQMISIILPNKISNYVRSLSTKTVTDKTAAEAIMMFGLERKLENWEPPKGIYKSLQQLTRERSQLIEERTMLKNRRHAELAGAKPNKKSVERVQKRISLLLKQEKEIEKELKLLIKEDKEVKAIVLLICSIPGIADLTAATILGETNGFELIKNKRQLASYAGFDVIEKQSGTSVKAKTKISKRGNRHLRKAMYFPAIAAIRCNPKSKDIYERLFSKNGIKMKGGVAVQRRLLEMAYTVFKTKTRFDKNYEAKKLQKEDVKNAA